MMKEAAMKKEVDNPAGTKEEAVVVVVIEEEGAVEAGVVDPEAVEVEVEAASTVVMKDIRVENALKNVWSSVIIVKELVIWLTNVLKSVSNDQEEVVAAVEEVTVHQE
jgi:hypothetical protein